MNYLQYVYDAVKASASVDVYSFAAPQGTTEDHIVISIQSVDITENKDEQAAEQVSATLFLHYNDADQAQKELSDIRANLRHYPRVLPMFEDFVNADSGILEGEACAADALDLGYDSPFKQAYLEGMQYFYDDINERILLAADFIFILNN